MKPTYLGLKLFVCIPLFFIFSTSAFARKTIDSVQLIMEPLDLVVHDEFRLGVKIFLSNGKVRKTDGLLRGNIAWHRITFKSDQGRINDDYVLKLNHDLVRANNNTLEIKVEYRFKGNDREFVFKKPFPQLDSIRILNKKIYAHNTNSIRLKGYFSNGKSYVISNTRSYPGFNNRDFVLEAEPYLRREKLSARYTPQLDRLFPEIPICVSNNQHITSIYLPTDFDVHVTVTRKGFDGQNGERGEDGEDASDEGYDGGTGGGGWHAGHGQKPETVFVYLAEVDSFYLCWVIQQEFKKKYLLGKNGRLIVENIGGNGGRGGKGGTGGAGGDSSEEYDPGSGGSGGPGGDGGHGGDGGDIIVYHDILPDDAQRIVKPRSIAGSGGLGGSGGSGGKNGFDYNTSDTLLGLLATLIRGKGSSGKDGLGGSKGKEGEVTFDCMNADEYYLIHTEFGMVLD